MPIIKSAGKKLRQDKKRTQRNLKLKSTYKEALKKAKKTHSAASIKKAYSLIDKAAKSKVIHKNKANRLKSQLAHARKS